MIRPINDNEISFSRILEDDIALHVQQSIGISNAQSHGHKAETNSLLEEWGEKKKKKKSQDILKRLRTAQFSILKVWIWNYSKNK